MRTGIDIVEVSRIGRLMRDKSFLERVFTPRELAYCAGKKNRAQHLAVRFAAKEAVIKALGRRGVALRDIGVVNGPDGRPAAQVRGRRVRGMDISLSHTDHYAAAVAVLTGPRERVI